MVMRLMPDMQTGPAGYALAWGLLILAVLAVLLTTGLGGALVLAGMGAVVLLLAYFVWKRFIGWLL